MAGSMVIPTLWHSLHDESVYPEPYKFNPLRWGPDGIAEQNHKYLLLEICILMIKELACVWMRTSRLPWSELCHHALGHVSWQGLSLP